MSNVFRGGWGMVAIAAAALLIPIVLIGFVIAPMVRWRFSVRALLIATAMVSVVLGLAMWVARK
jgi:hypothetical protein